MVSVDPAGCNVYLQGVKPVEPAGPGFMFNAEKAPDQGAGQVASRPHNSRRRQTAAFKPFQFSTDVSDAQTSKKGPGCPCARLLPRTSILLCRW